MNATSIQSLCSSVEKFLFATPLDVWFDLAGSNAKMCNSIGFALCAMNFSFEKRGNISV